MRVDASSHESHLSWPAAKNFVHACVCVGGTYCFCNNIIEGRQIWKYLGKHRLHNIFFSWLKREQKLHENGLDITSIFRQPYFNSHATLVLVIWPGHENWENSHSNSRFSTLMQLLFSCCSFDRGTRIEKTLMQTLASQLSCNSCSRLTEAWELRKLSCKLSLLNSHQLSCKLSLLNSHQLSCNSCSRLTGAWELRKLSCKLSPLNSHATLVLVWPGHENWENSHANPRFSTLTNVWAGLTIIIYLLAVIDYNRNNKHVWAEEHKDVTLSCDINGYPAPVFSWVKNKTVVTTGSRSLTLLHVKQNESCTYECWGNNTLGYNAMLVKLRVASK